VIEIEKVDHLGIRVMDSDRAVAFYALLGFGDPYKVPDDDVTIIRNKHGVEINLITNGTNNNSGKNILMDVTDKFPGYTHVALRVTSGNQLSVISSQLSATISDIFQPRIYADGHRKKSL